MCDNEQNEVRICHISVRQEQKANAAYYDDNWTERKERKAYYQSFTKDKLLAMNCTIATAQPNCNGQTLSKMVLPHPLPNRSASSQNWKNSCRCVKG